MCIFCQEKMNFHLPQRQLRASYVNTRGGNDLRLQLTRRNFLNLSASAAAVGLLASAAPRGARAQTAPAPARRLLRGGTVMTLDGA